MKERANEQTTAREQPTMPETSTGGAAASVCLRALLPRLMRGENLTRREAAQLLDAVLDGGATDAQAAGALISRKG